MTAEISNLKAIIDNGTLQRMMQNANDNFNSIEENIRKNINNNIPEVERAIADAGTLYPTRLRHFSTILFSQEKLWIKRIKRSKDSSVI